MNQEYNTNRMLIEKYVDNVLNEEEAQKAATLINEDGGARETYAELKTAVTAIRYAAINQQVAAVAQQYFNKKQGEKETTDTRTAKVINFKRVAMYSLRVAAAVILIAGSYTAVSYQSASTDGLYSDGFVPYDISVTRNSTASGNIEQAYMQQNWHLVINAAKQQPASQKINFLAGMAALQLNQYKVASEIFNNLDALNKQSAEKLYSDDCEYYLALTYFKTGEADKAIQMLQSIRNNPMHQYRQAAKNISTFKLKLLEYKQ